MLSAGFFRSRPPLALLTFNKWHKSGKSVYLRRFGRVWCVWEVSRNAEYSRRPAILSCNRMIRALHDRQLFDPLQDLLTFAADPTRSFHSTTMGSESV